MTRGLFENVMLPEISSQLKAQESEHSTFAKACKTPTFPKIRLSQRTPQHDAISGTKSLLDPHQLTTDVFRDRRHSGDELSFTYDMNTISKSRFTPDHNALTESLHTSTGCIDPENDINPVIRKRCKVAFMEVNSESRGFMFSKHAGNRTPRPILKSSRRTTANNPLKYLRPPASPRRPVSNPGYLPPLSQQPLVSRTGVSDSHTTLNHGEQSGGSPFPSHEHGTPGSFLCSREFSRVLEHLDTVREDE